MSDQDIGPETTSGRPADISAGRARGGPTSPGRALGGSGGTFPGDPDIASDETGAEDPAGDSDTAAASERDST